MSPLALAHRYMDIFFSGNHLEKLSDIFSEDFNFDGPFNRYSSAKDYIDSLTTDPPEDCSYRMIHSFEDDTCACLVYDFSKPGVCATMAQLFETKNGKIRKIVLLFDTAEFPQSDEKL